MSGIASSVVSPPRYRHPAPRPRSESKRSRIVDAAMRHFAEQGYHGSRVGDIASALGIAKGSIFQHFGSKDGLFFEAYKKAVRSFRVTLTSVLHEDGALIADASHGKKITLHLSVIARDARNKNRTINRKLSI